MPSAMLALDKDDLLNALRERLEQRRRTLVESQRSSQAGATHEEARAEHPKDTRATEASYVARGLAERVEQTEAGLRQLEQFHPRAVGPGEAAGLGALVGVENEDGEESVHFLLPVAGGEKISTDQAIVHVVSPNSPLGRELLGRNVGEDFELELPRGRVSGLVAWVR